MKKRMMIVSILGLLVSVGSALGIDPNDSAEKYVPVSPCKRAGDQCFLRMNCKPGEMCAQIVLHGLCDASLGCKQPGEHHRRVRPDPAAGYDCRADKSRRRGNGHRRIG